MNEVSDKKIVVADTVTAEEPTMKPYTTSDELPNPITKKDKQTGAIVFKGYGEPRYFMRATPTSYELIKVFKKVNSVFRKHVCTMKRGNKAHMARVNAYKKAGIPIQ